MGLHTFLLFSPYTSTFYTFSNTIINNGSAMASMRRCCDWVSNFTLIMISTFQRINIVQTIKKPQQWQLNLIHSRFCSKNESLPVCPDCSLVECIPKITPSDCPKGTFWEEGILWGCCPACTTRLQIGMCLHASLMLF